MGHVHRNQLARKWGLGSVRDGAILGSLGGVSPAEQASAGAGHPRREAVHAAERVCIPPRGRGLSVPGPVVPCLWGHGEPTPDVPELVTALAGAVQGPFAVLPSGGIDETRTLHKLRLLP